MGILQSAESFLLEINRQKWTSDISCATHTVYLLWSLWRLQFSFHMPSDWSLSRFWWSGENGASCHTSEKCRSPFLYKHTVKATNKLLNISSAMWKKMLLIELKLIVCDNMAKRQKSNSEALMKRKAIQEKTVQKSIVQKCLAKFITFKNMFCPDVHGKYPCPEQQPKNK